MKVIGLRGEIPGAITFIKMYMHKQPGFTIFGGLSPPLATYLIKIFANPLMPAYAFIGTEILGAIGIIWHLRRV